MGDKLLDAYDKWTKLKKIYHKKPPWPSNAAAEMCQSGRSFVYFIVSINYYARLSKRYEMSRFFPHSHHLLFLT